MSKYVIGVDLGGTKVEACLMNNEREVLARQRVFSEAGAGLDHVIENILTVIDKVSVGKHVLAVGIGTPGTYVSENDALYGVPHTLVYETPGFMGRIKDRLNVPLIIENDANCLALAEYYANCIGKYRYVLAVIIGTGMGYGLILDGKLYRGAVGAAGEIGHTSIDYAGRLCECGRRGCAEAYLSGSSLTRRFKELSGRALPVNEIYKLYESGDALANDFFKENFKLMAAVFANTVNAFDLEAIILGGGVSNIPVWYQEVPKYLNRLLFGPPRGEVPIIKAQMGDSAGVLGAAYLALREIGIMDF